MPSPSRCRALAAAALVAPALAACGPSLEPRTAPGPAAPATPAAPAAPAFTWAATGQGAYQVTSRAAITVAEEPGEARDSVTTTALVRLALVDGRITGAVDSLHVQAGARVPAVPPPPLPVRFTGTLRDGRATLAATPAVTPAPPAPGTVAPGAPPCAAADDAALMAARELFPTIPAGATVGSRWADTVRTASCRGGLRLDVTAAHRYTVVAHTVRDGRPALRVERLTELLVQGAGEQAREAVAVTGRGTGRATLHLAPAPGRLLDATGEATLELAFTGAGRTQRVVQRSVTEVRGVP